MKPTLKICGLQKEEEAVALRDLAVDYIGFNFIPGARPQISYSQAQSLVRLFHYQQPDSIRQQPKFVGLFKDQPLQEVADSATRLRLDYVQLNGDEDQSYSDALPVPVLRTIAVASDSSEQSIFHYIKEHAAAYYILDRKKQGQGTPVSQTLARSIAAHYPGRIFLAGGITPETLKETISNVRPYGIDISGGVRTDGFIDAAKVKQCVQALTFK